MSKAAQKSNLTQNALTVLEKRYLKKGDDGEPAETPEAIEAAAETAPAPNRQLVISLSQSSDEDRDTAFLHELMAILNDFPGQDEVKLSVSNDDRFTVLKLPRKTNYCPELQQRLAELVGENGLSLETADQM